MEKEAGEGSAHGAMPDSRVLYGQNILLMCNFKITKKFVVIQLLILSVE